MANPAPTPKKQPLNLDWDLAAGKSEEGNYSLAIITAALLTDIRAELRKLNKTLTEASIFVNGKVG
jgi:hypothetical protein